MSGVTSIGEPTSKAERLGLQFEHRLPTEHMLDSMDGYLCEVYTPVARARAIIQAHFDEMMSAPEEAPSILLPEAAILELQDALELIQALESKVCKGW